MGFANLAVVMNIIAETYAIESEINALTNVKFSIADQIDDLNSCDMTTDDAFKPITVQKIPCPANSIQHWGAGSQAQDNADEHPYMRITNKKDLEKLIENLYHDEKNVDMKMEPLKAKLTALQAQKQEFQEYTKTAIQSTFKNNYMG